MLGTEETIFWLISNFMLAMCFDVNILERYIHSFKLQAKRQTSEFVILLKDKK
jgi:hypothetical protein